MSNTASGISTKDAARRVKISRASLHGWMAAGEIKPPALRVVDGHAVRLWTPADLNRLRAVKRALYRKPRQRKGASR